MSLMLLKGVHVTMNLHAFTKGSQLIHCLSQLHHRLMCMLHIAFTASDMYALTGHQPAWCWQNASHLGPAVAWCIQQHIAE